MIAETRILWALFLNQAYKNSNFTVRIITKIMASQSTKKPFRTLLINNDVNCCCGIKWVMILMCFCIGDIVKCFIHRPSQNKFDCSMVAVCFVHGGIFFLIDTTLNLKPIWSAKYHTQDSKEINQELKYHSMRLWLRLASV